MCVSHVALIVHPNDLWHWAPLICCLPFWMWIPLVGDACPCIFTNYYQVDWFFLSNLTKFFDYSGNQSSAGVIHWTRHLLPRDFICHPLKDVFHWTEVPNLVEDQFIHLSLYVYSFSCLRSLGLPQIYEAICLFYILKAILIYHSQSDFSICHKIDSKYKCFPSGQIWLRTCVSAGIIYPKCLPFLQCFLVPLLSSSRIKHLCASIYFWALRCVQYSLSLLTVQLYNKGWYLITFNFVANLQNSPYS